MEDIKTTTRNAYDPNTGEKYQIEFPALEEIRKAILCLYQSSQKIIIKDTTEKIAIHFNLQEKQKAAKTENNHKIFYYMVADSINKLFKKSKLHQPGGERTPYFLVEENDQEEHEEIKGEEQRQDEKKDEAPTVESIEEIYQNIHEQLATELLEHIKNNTPTFFEELVIDLLVAMGYGGTRADAEAVGRSHDGGIDGIIKEDPFGLDVVYVQAKRWSEGKVQEPDVARFAGALASKGATKGIFITTSDYTKGARNYTAPGFNIVRINGTQLAQLMIEHNIGVSTAKTYEIKRVDSDYFAENR